MTPAEQLLNSCRKRSTNLVGMIPGETSGSGQMYLTMIMTVTYQVPITLNALKVTVSKQH